MCLLPNASTHSTYTQQMIELRLRHERMRSLMVLILITQWSSHPGGLVFGIVGYVQIKQFDELLVQDPHFAASEPPVLIEYVGQ